MYKKILLLICVFAAAVSLCAGCNEDKNPQQEASSHEVAIIDKTALMKMAAFRKAGESAAAAIEELRKSYSDKMKDATPEQQKELVQMYNQEEAGIRHSEFRPAMERMEAAIALVAKEKGVKAVLDKSVVVTGAQDITESVKEKFREEGELQLPDEDIGDASVIGYFDQTVVRNMQMFRDLDRVMFEDFQKANKELEAKSQDLSEEQRRNLIAQYEERMEKKRSQLSLPLLSKVTETVEKVAKDNSLVLVLDKQYVMYGGKNVTDKVVDLLKDEKGPQLPAPSAAPQKK